jgi:hypothetical protein
MPIPVGMGEGAAATTVEVDGTEVANTIEEDPAAGMEDPMAVTVEATTAEAEAGAARESPTA